MKYLNFRIIKSKSDKRYIVQVSRNCEKYKELTEEYKEKSGVRKSKFLTYKGAIKAINKLQKEYIKAYPDLRAYLEPKEI